MKASAVLVAIGIVALVTMIFDVLWTVLAAGSGAGPVTGRLAARLWRVALRLGRTPQGPRHRFLAACGVSINVGVLLAWVLVVWAAWWLLFSATPGAVRVAATGKPADLGGRAAFTGSSLFTLGSTDYTAGSGAWQLAAVGATASGLVFITLSITYLVPVASAVAERRQYAAYISSLGHTPEQIVAGAWTGHDFGSLAQHLVALTPMVILAGERHLTYPVLHYFHTATERTAAAQGIVVLDDALTLLAHGVAPEARPDPAALRPLSEAVGLFLETLRSAFIAEAPEPLAWPDLDALRRAGVPTVDDGVFAAALDGHVARRRLLAGLLADDGWTPDAWRRHLEAQPAG